MCLLLALFQKLLAATKAGLMEAAPPHWCEEPIFDRTSQAGAGSSPGRSATIHVYI